MLVGDTGWSDVDDIMKKLKQFYTDECRAVWTSAAEATQLAQDVVETKRDNVVLFERNSGLLENEGDTIRRAHDSHSGKLILSTGECAGRLDCLRRISLRVDDW